MLPEPRNPTAYQPVPLPTQPTAGPLTPAPARRIVGYERYADDLMVPVYETAAPVARVEPRDLTPQPLFDPVAQRLVGGGVFAAGVGVGCWLLFSALAGATTALALLFGVLLVAKLPAAGRGGTTVHVHQRAGMFGRNHNTNR